MRLLDMIHWGELNAPYRLFDNISLPDGINKETLIDRIVYKNYDLSLYITDYTLLHLNIINFFLTRLENYQKIVDALGEDYNPIHNFDRYEIKDEKTTNNANNKNVDSINGNEEYKTSAFNSNDYQPKDKTTSTQTRTDTREDKQNGTYTSNNHLYGNIGVTTSQQMIESEMELRQTYIIYDMIATDFRKEFCLCIYE